MGKKKAEKTEPVLSEREIIVKMRKALDILKAKYAEEAGAWVLLDFLEAGLQDDSWVRTVAEAERLSDPYMPGA